MSCVREKRVCRMTAGGSVRTSESWLLNKKQFVSCSSLVKGPVYVCVCVCERERVQKVCHPQSKEWSFTGSGLKSHQHRQEEIQLSLSCCGVFSFLSLFYGMCLLLDSY